jgi:hypothetical protein
VKGICHGLIWKTVTAFTWKDWWKPRIKLFMLFSVIDIWFIAAWGSGNTCFKKIILAISHHNLCWHHSFTELKNILPVCSRIFRLAASVGTEMRLGEGRGGTIRSPDITRCLVRGVAHIWVHAHIETGKNSALRDSSYWKMTIFHFRP